MTSKVKVFTTQDFCNAVNTNLKNVLVVEKKKNSKNVNGTEFLNAYVNIGAETRKELWLTVENLPLTTGIADPAKLKEQKKNVFESNRLQLQTSVSRAGDFGQALLKLNNVWREIITKMSEVTEDPVTKKKVLGAIDMDGKKIHDLLQLTLSKKNTENPGAEIEDPVIRFQVDFAKFSEKFPHSFLRGQQKTQFYDARTAYKDEKGVTQYKLATYTVEKDGVDVEVPYDESNIHEFVTPGSVLVSGRIMAPSVPVSQSWVSWPWIMNKAVILPGGDGGFDEGGDAPVVTTPVKLDMPLAAPVAVDNSTKQEPAAEESVDELL